MPKITQNEWLDELERIIHEREKAEDGTFTSREMAKALGINQKRAQELIREMVEQGRVAFAGRRRTCRIDGVPTFVPTYRVIKGKGA